MGHAVDQPTSRKNGEVGTRPPGLILMTDYRLSIQRQQKPAVHFVHYQPRTRDNAIGSRIGASGVGDEGNWGTHRQTNRQGDRTAPFDLKSFVALRTFVHVCYLHRY